MKPHSVLSGLLLITAHLAPAFGLYSDRDAVVELTPKNFNSVVMDSNHLVAVEFYAPWCGHCQRLAPEWKKAANNLKGLVTVAAVNCDEETNRPLCGQYQIKGFPTIKTFHPDRRVDKKTGATAKKPKDYQGPRDARSIIDFFLNMMPSNVRFIKGDPSKVKAKKSITIDDFLATENATLPKVLLFTDKATTAPLYKALSVDFGDERLLFGEVKKAEKDVVSQFGVTKYPTLFVISPEAGLVPYTGKIKHEPLYQFLEQYALPKQDKKGRISVTKEKPVEVVEISSDEAMKQYCVDSAKICVIAIVQEEDRASTITMLKTLNQQFQLFQFGWIMDSKASPIMKKLDLAADLPSLLLVHTSKHLYRPYIGAWSEEALSKWLNQIATGKLQAWPYQGDLSVKGPERLRDEL